MEEQTAPMFLLRVFFSREDIQKMKLPEKPHSIEALENELTKQFKLEYNFHLQYDDTCFNNEPCNLVDIVELENLSTIRVIRHEESVADHDVAASFVANVDAGVSSPGATASPSSLRTTQSWPVTIVLPLFGYDVNYTLKRADDEYATNDKHFTPNKSMKGQILDVLSNFVYSIKMYPTDGELESIAKALVDKHPSLMEPGCGTAGSGYLGWKNSLKFKMGNFRNKLRLAGCVEAMANSGRKSKYNPDAPSPRLNMKKARRNEANFLPNFPQGQDEKSMEDLRKSLVNEAGKTRKDLKSIEIKAATTFSLRRKEIIEEAPRVSVVKERWPALFLLSQMKAEFTRITNIQLEQRFFSALDELLPGLMKMFKKTTTGKQGKKIKEELENSQQSTDENVDKKRTAVLRIIPIYFGEDRGILYRDFMETEEEDILNDDVTQFVATIGKDVSLIMEKTVVVDKLPSFAHGVAYMFALHYIMNLNFPGEPAKKSYTFEFLQKMIMGLNVRKFSPKMVSFNNALKGLYA